MNAGMIYVSRSASRGIFKSGEVYCDYATEGKLSTGVLLGFPVTVLL